MSVRASLRPRWASTSCSARSTPRPRRVSGPGKRRLARRLGHRRRRRRDACCDRRLRRQRIETWTARSVLAFALLVSGNSTAVLSAISIRLLKTTIAALKFKPDFVPALIQRALVANKTFQRYDRALVWIPTSAAPDRSRRSGDPERTRQRSMKISTCLKKRSPISTMRWRSNRTSRSLSVRAEILIDKGGLRQSRRRSRPRAATETRFGAGAFRARGEALPSKRTRAAIMPRL